MKTFLIIIAIVYGVLFIPALRTSIAFWLYRDKDATAYLAMRHGFLFGFFSIWFIYPIYLIKDCFSKNDKD